MNIAVIKCHEISYDKRLEIVFYKNNDKSYQEIATIVGCSKNEASAVRKKFSKYRTVKICQGFVDQRRSSRQDMKGLHGECCDVVGLNFYKTWCWRAKQSNF